MAFDIIALRRFEAVCRLRSFKLAADELGLSQAAITKSIQALEDGLNVRLLDRTTRAVAPTEAGMRLFRLAPGILHHVADVRGQVVGAARQVTVVCGPAMTDMVMQLGVLEFCNSHDVQIDFRSAHVWQALDLLDRRQADVLLFHAAVATSLESRASLRITHLGSEPYMFFCRPDHPVLQTSRTVSDLLSYDWVVAGFHRSFHRELTADLRDLLLRRGFPRIRAPSFKGCIDLVAHSDFLTAMPKSIPHFLPETASLHCAPLPIPLDYSLCAVQRVEAVRQTAANAFVDSLASAYSAVTSGLGLKNAAG